MTRLEAVIFDVDGTLVDSERDGHRVAFNAAFEEAGLPDRWDVAEYGHLLAVAGGAKRLAFYLESTGRTAADAHELTQRLHKRKTEIMRELIADGHIEPRPGARELIDELASRGVWMHVATTGTRAWVEPLLRQCFGEPFGTIVTGTEITTLKPDPAAYLEVLRRTGQSAVAIEDSANGVRAAIAAGLPCLAAANDYTRDDDFTGAAVVGTGLDDPRVTDWLRHRVG